MSKTQTPKPQDSGLELPLEAHTYTEQYQNDKTIHTDAEWIRREFGIEQYDREGYEPYKRHVYPNMIEHVWDGPPTGATRDKGGTDMLATGMPGSGKSTWLLYLTQRLLEINNEIVVWRASGARSEWLPLAPITRLLLPRHAEADAWLQPLKDRKNTTPIDDLEDVVREVVYYDSVRHLNSELLRPGMFHVVYPDPTMSGAQAVYEDVPEKQYDGLEFRPEDPSKHWWFAWVLDRIENGPYHWTTWIADEIGDLAPQSALKDDFATYQKVQLLKDCYVDARKTGLSMFAAGHSEVDIHDSIRRKIRWRVQMPGKANPTRGSEIIGFDSVEQEEDWTSDMEPGEILVYNERNFDDLEYDYLPAPFNPKLKISLKSPEGGGS